MSSTPPSNPSNPRRKSNLGILSDRDTDDVPGSVFLLSKVHRPNEPLASSSTGPEKKRTKDGRFILDPQPDDSVNDPLNWTQLRRDTALVSLGFYCMVGGGMTPLLAAAFNDVAETYRVTVPQVALTTGFYMLGLGLGSVVASPTAILWGKRPVYLASIVVFVLSAIWCALSPNYPSLVVARIVQGFAVSPVECLPSASIAEIFFLHERACRLGIYTLLLLGGKNLIPLVSAVVVQSLGWRWVFWLVAVVVVFCFFLLFFFVPESFWDRTPTRARGQVPRRNAEKDQASEPFSVHYTDHLRSAPSTSYVQSLKPYNGRLTKDSWLHVMARPFILFAYPAVLWSSMCYALAVGWLIVLSESVAHIYKNRESYNFNALQVGLVYISPFVGGILGTAVAGKISDVVVRFMARRNGGVYEPEFRLIMVLPIALSTVIGLMGFGWSAEEKDNWIVPTLFFGVISFGCSLGSTTAVTFVVDSYRIYAGEALVTLNFSKNILHGLVFSLFFPHWLEASGAKEVFLAVGGIQLGCMLFSIPMYVYGKRARMWTARKKLMEKL